jgi:negative regulator of sigma-B (phosphoserine phosphatase)
MASETAKSIPGVVWGVAMRPLRGESVSGDHYLIRPIPNGVLIAVIDGLGHGSPAALIAQTAVAVLGEYAAEAIPLLLQRCHERLLGTRGAAISLATLNGQDNSLTWLGVGNVEGALLRSGAKTNQSWERMLVRGGVVGYQLPLLQPSTLPLKPDDILVVATDGIRSEFTEDLVVAEPPQHIANHILSHYGKEVDDALVLVVRFIGDRS